MISRRQDFPGTNDCFVHQGQISRKKGGHLMMMMAMERKRGRYGFLSVSSQLLGISRDGREQERDESLGDAPEHAKGCDADAALGVEGKPPMTQLIC